jgi:hypothetical protein
MYILYACIYVRTYILYVRTYILYLCTDVYIVGYACIYCMHVYMRSGAFQELWSCVRVLLLRKHLTLVEHMRSLAVEMYLSGWWWAKTCPLS